MLGQPPRLELLQSEYQSLPNKVDLEQDKWSEPEYQQVLRLELKPLEYQSVLNKVEFPQDKPFEPEYQPEYQQV